MQLFEAFQKNQTLSVAQIEKLLHCNRQSVYNYIKRFEENGCTLTKFTQNNHTYYSLSPDSATSDEILYEPMTFDVLRKYTIIQQLQQGAILKEKLKDRFAFYSKMTQSKKTSELCSPAGEGEAELCETQLCVTDELTDQLPTTEERDCTPLDIGMTQYYHILNDLIDAGEIELNPSTQKYFLTGKNIPLKMVLDGDALFNLYISLESITKGTPYYDQFKSIYHKTSVLLGDVTDTTPYFENYIVYGKKLDGLSSIAKQLKMITAHNYQNKVLQIRYRTRKDGERSVLFAIGMLLYSVEKDVLYLVGEEYFQKNNAQKHPYSIIKTSSIMQIEETIVIHSCYHSDYYMQLFDAMFSISVEPPVNVKIEFDIVPNLNIERKIRYLAKQRKYATYEIIENKIIYTDTISGLDDFAVYLRRFGRTAHVIEPPALKDKMRDSIAQTLHRYEICNY